MRRVVAFCLLVSWGVPLEAAKDPLMTIPVCDVAVDSAICLHGEEKVLLPDARPYGLEMHLDFDSIRPLDTSGLRNHASGETLSAAGVGGAGSSGLFRKNYVYVPHSSSFMSADFSYTFFVYLLDDSESRLNNSMHDQYCPIIHKGIMREDIQEAAPAILFNPKDGRIKVVLGTSKTMATAGEEMQSNSRLKPHMWYHIAVVRHINRIRLYVDGILDSTFVTEGATRTNDLPIYIGGAPYSENVCDTPLLIDELKIYSRAVGRDEIQAEASIVLNGVEPSYIHLGCVSCNKEEAVTACPDGYHLCDKLELYTGGYQVARKLSLGYSLVSSGSATPASGTALCCADS